MSDLRTRCQQIVETLVVRHDWQLWTRVEFAQQIEERVKADEVDEEALTKLAVNLYCGVWHEACGSSGARRMRAYNELARYLYDRALHKYHDLEMAQEITHEAILLISQQLDQVRNPGAFLAFALLKLWNAATTYFRQRDRHARRSEPLPDPSDVEQPGEVADLQTPQPEAAVVQGELERFVRARIDALIADAPRARSQFQAVLLKFLHGYSDAEIAETLETDVASVHVLRSRGLNRLRTDVVLIRLFEEMIDS